MSSHGSTTAALCAARLFVNGVVSGWEDQPERVVMTENAPAGTHAESRTKRDLTIEIWERLDCESVGKTELEIIQQSIRERFGEGAVESPAAIARILADEGAVLRHPDVLECDARWREQQSSLRALSFESLEQAAESIRAIEARRRALAQSCDIAATRRLQAAVELLRTELLLEGRSEIVAAQRRAEAKEIAAWLQVWLSSPELFADWLELRRRSPAFRKQFEAES